MEVIVLITETVETHIVLNGSKRLNMHLGSYAVHCGSAISTTISAFGIFRILKLLENRIGAFYSTRADPSPFPSAPAPLNRPPFGSVNVLCGPVLVPIIYGLEVLSGVRKLTKKGRAEFLK